jgi:hypothetical protein
MNHLFLPLSFFFAASSFDCFWKPIIRSFIRNCVAYINRDLALNTQRQQDDAAPEKKDDALNIMLQILQKSLLNLSSYVTVEQWNVVFNEVSFRRSVFVFVCFVCVMIFHFYCFTDVVSFRSQVDQYYNNNNKYTNSDFRD